MRKPASTTAANVVMKAVRRAKFLAILIELQCRLSGKIKAVRGYPVQRGLWLKRCGNNVITIGASRDFVDVDHMLHKRTN
jgi:hypothetical protein